MRPLNKTMRWMLIFWVGLLSTLFGEEFDPTRIALQKQTGDTRFRHAADITSVSLFSDGKRIVTAGRDGTARIWDTATWKSIQRTDYLSGPCAFSPDGTRLAVPNGTNVVLLQVGKPWNAVGTLLTKQNLNLFLV